MVNSWTRIPHVTNHDEADITEMEEFRKHGVYVKVPIQQCWDRTGKNPIGVRWVDINKGDDRNPKYRSRLVAKEFKVGEAEELFVATTSL